MKNNFMMIMILFFISICLSSIAYSYDGDLCNNTHTPCSAGIDGLCSSTDLSSMFEGVTDFDNVVGDITGWNTSCITLMNSLFSMSDFNQNISSWNIEQVGEMNDIFLGVNLSTSIYDDILNSWSQQIVFESITFNGGYSIYSDIGKIGRDILKFTYDWMITDGNSQYANIKYESIINSSMIYECSDNISKYLLYESFEDGILNDSWNVLGGENTTITNITFYDGNLSLICSYNASFNCVQSINYIFGNDTAIIYYVSSENNLTATLWGFTPLVGFDTGSGLSISGFYSDIDGYNTYYDGTWKSFGLSEPYNNNDWERWYIYPLYVDEYISVVSRNNITFYPSPIISTSSIQGLASFPSPIMIGHTLASSFPIYYDKIMVWNTTLYGDSCPTDYEAPICVPDWICSEYESCPTNLSQTCNAVADLNLCGDTYSGNYSEFTQSCERARVPYTLDNPDTSGIINVLIAFFVFIVLTSIVLTMVFKDDENIRKYIIYIATGFIILLMIIFLIAVIS